MLSDYLPPKGAGMPLDIGIMGGSFNPPHMGHAYMLLSVLMTQKLDQIWVMPCADHAFKSDLAPFDTRLQMCIEAFHHLESVRVLDFESTQPQPNYTTNTLEAIKELRPDWNLHYIVGGDLVEEIPDWENAEGLTDLCEIIVVPRQGHPLIDPPPEIGDFTLVELAFDLPELSSSHIKKLLRRRANVDGLLPRDVLYWIKEEGLYGLDSANE